MEFVYSFFDVDYINLEKNTWFLIIDFQEKLSIQIQWPLVKVPFFITTFLLF
jgi:hypothetical protein